MESSVEYYKDFFFGHIAKMIDSSLKDQLSERKLAENKKRDLEEKLSTVCDEIKKLESEIEIVREKAIHDKDHKDQIQNIISNRDRIKVLEEMKVEIINELIPAAEKRCDNATTWLRDSVDEIVRQVTVPYQKELVDGFTDLINKIEGFAFALEKLSDEKLSLPGKFRLDQSNRPFLPIKRSMSY